MAKEIYQIELGDQIIDVPAWATEGTLQEMTKYSSGSVAALLQLVKISDKEGKAIEEIKKLQKEMVSSNKSRASIDNRVYKEFNAETVRGAQILKTAHDKLSKITGSIASSFNNNDLSGMAKAVGSIVGLGTVAGFTAGIIEEYAKNTTELANIGIGVGASLQDLRNQAASAGLNLESYNKLVMGNSEALRGLGKTQQEGSRNFADISNRARDAAGDLHQFGLSNTEYNEILLQEIDLRRQAGMSQAQITNNVGDAMNKLMTEVTGLSALTGKDRRDILRNRLEFMSQESIIAARLAKQARGEDLTGFDTALTTFSALGDEATRLGEAMLSSAETGYSWQALFEDAAVAGAINPNASREMQNLFEFLDSGLDGLNPEEVRVGIFRHFEAMRDSMSAADYDNLKRLANQLVDNEGAKLLTRLMGTLQGTDLSESAARNLEVDTDKKLADSPELALSSTVEDLANNIRSAALDTVLNNLSDDTDEAGKMFIAKLKDISAALEKGDTSLETWAGAFSELAGDGMMGKVGLGAAIIGPAAVQVAMATYLTAMGTRNIYRLARFALGKLRVATGAAAGAFAGTTADTAFKVDEPKEYSGRGKSPGADPKRLPPPPKSLGMYAETIDNFNNTLDEVYKNTSSALSTQVQNSIDDFTTNIDLSATTTVNSDALFAEVKATFDEAGLKIDVDTESKLKVLTNNAIANFKTGFNNATGAVTNTVDVAELQEAITKIYNDTLADINLQAKTAVKSGAKGAIEAYGTAVKDVLKPISSDGVVIPDEFRTGITSDLATGLADSDSAARTVIKSGAKGAIDAHVAAIAEIMQPISSDGVVIPDEFRTGLTSDLATGLVDSDAKVRGTVRSGAKGAIDAYGKVIGDIFKPISSDGVVIPDEFRTGLTSDLATGLVDSDGKVRATMKSGTKGAIEAHLAIVRDIFKPISSEGVIVPDEFRAGLTSDLAASLAESDGHVRGAVRSGATGALDAHVSKIDEIFQPIGADGVTVGQSYIDDINRIYLDSLNTTRTSIANSLQTAVEETTRAHAGVVEEIITSNKRGTKQYSGRGESPGRIELMQPTTESTKGGKALRIAKLLSGPLAALDFGWNAATGIADQDLKGAGYGLFGRIRHGLTGAGLGLGDLGINVLGAGADWATGDHLDLSWARSNMSGWWKQRAIDNAPHRQSGLDMFIPQMVDDSVTARVAPTVEYVEGKVTGAIDTLVDTTSYLFSPDSTADGSKVHPMAKPTRKTRGQTSLMNNEQSIEDMHPRARAMLKLQEKQLQETTESNRLLKRAVEAIENQ